MSKLKKSTLPANHTKDDFKCFGPVATKDGEFSGTMLCDLGCFKQGDIDSNKYYFAAVVQSKINNNWYAYFEYGRTGQTTNPQFQFIEGPDKATAQLEYEKQLHSKNDKRGMWVDKGVLGKVLQPKPNKDCYLVRPLSSRNTGLPDAKNITNAKVAVASSVHIDSESLKLIQDLNVGSTEYARGSIVGEAIPTPEAIEQCRKILDEATKINNIIDWKNGLNDKDYGKKRNSKFILQWEELTELTNMAYSLIQKHKKRKAELEEWILNPDNIQKWRDDLDVYENVVSGISTSSVSNIPFDIEYIRSDNRIYKIIQDFVSKATRNRHSYLGKIKIINLWKTSRPEHYNSFRKKTKEIVGNNKLKPLHQIDRIDIPEDEKHEFINSGTWQLFHGTRSVNVGSILQTGLRLPKELSNVAINGALIGGGSYFADDWKKSAGYCSINNSYWARGSGGISNRGGFMFVCDVVLGNPYKIQTAKVFNKPPDGFNSVFLEAGQSVVNNEFVIYNTIQSNLRYLVEFGVM